MPRKNSYFQKDSGTYICWNCGRRTRATGQGEAEFDLCAPCFELEGIANMHSDDGHDGEVWDCTECKSQMSAKALKHLETYKFACLSLPIMEEAVDEGLKKARS